MLRFAGLRSLAACLLACVVCAFATPGGAAAEGGHDGGNAREESVREGPRVLAAAQAGVGDLIADARLPDLKDLDGKALRLADYRGRPATVICLTSAGCPVAKKYGPALAELERAYRGRGVGFVVVNPDAAESPRRLRDAFDAMRKLGFGGRYVHDPRGALAARLRATSSTEAFVLDGALTVVYRGAIDDQFGLGYSLPAPRRRLLADALDAVLAGRAPAVEATTAPGCALDVKADAKDDPAPVVNYHNRISRILQRSCQECHRPGENGPFALTSYAEAKDHLAMIRKVVARGTMPPWFADAKVGHWANDRTLPPRDRDDLLAWIAAGAPEGTPADAPLPRRFADGWKIGTPDAVVEVPQPFRIPARGPIPYAYQLVQTHFDSDKWVKAVEIRTPNPQVVHHLLVFFRLPKEHPQSKEQQIDFRGGLGGYFAALVPGQGATVFPAGTAKLLPKGASLVFQVHYTPDGTAVEDRPKIGFVFADRPPEHELVTQAASNEWFRIPPGADNWPVAATYRFRGPTRLTSFMPHSHVRGKSFKYELTYPDGHTDVVLDVPRYDFNWQLEYQLATPIDVSAGATLRVTAHYDNGPDNPANPDPKAWVGFGEQTKDEMMIGYFTGHRLPAALP